MPGWVRRLRRPISALLAGAYLSGCGVIFNGTRQEILANSTPEVSKVDRSGVLAERVYLDYSQQ